MRADLRGPTTRFRRHCGRQGNRRQRLSSAVAGGPARGRGRGRPLPHFSAETGQRHTPALASATRGRPPLIDPQSPEGRVAVGRGAAIGVSEAGLAPQGKTQPPPPSAQKPPDWRSPGSQSFWLRQHSLSSSCPCTFSRPPGPRPATVRNPGILSSVPYFSIHSPPPPPPPPQPSEADTLCSDQGTDKGQRRLFPYSLPPTTPPTSEHFLSFRRKGKAVANSRN